MVKQLMSRFIVFLLVFGLLLAASMALGLL